MDELLNDIFDFMAADNKKVVIIKCKAYIREEFIELFSKEEKK